MNISFVVDQMRAGGAERVAANLSNEFSNLGHDVSIVMLNEVDERSHYTVNNKVKMIPVKKIYPKNNLIKKTLLLRNCFKEISPEVIISFLHHVNIYTYFASLGMGIPHIVSERNDPKQYPDKKLLRVLRDYVFKKADGCVFQTTDAKNFFSTVIQQKSLIIPNPVVLMHESAEPFEREKKITAAGRLVAQKNYDMMIRAFSIFLEGNPGYKLVICGEGNLQGNIEKLINDLKLTDSVILLGQVKNPHEIIYNSAVFALSSDHEGMPNALLEAMALGVPSVSTDCPCGGPSELIKNNENGILVSVGDIDAMAEAFSRIARSAEFSNKLSINARDVRETYSVRNIADKWLKYISDVIKRRE